MMGRKASLRLKVSRTFSILAQVVDYFSILWMSPRDLVAWNREVFSRRVHDITPEVYDFTDDEKVLLDPFLERRGNALVLGCGGGREAIALADCGWSVQALDMMEESLRAGQEVATKKGLEIEWTKCDLSSDAIPHGNYDLVCMFGHIYHCLPTRSHRVTLLKGLRERLSENGVLVFPSPFVKPQTKIDKYFGGARSLLSRLVFANPELDPGDRWSMNDCYHRVFYSIEELIEEFKEAGYEAIRVETIETQVQGVVFQKKRVPAHVG